MPVQKPAGTLNVMMGVVVATRGMCLVLTTEQCAEGVFVVNETSTSLFCDIHVQALRVVSALRRIVPGALPVAIPLVMGTDAVNVPPTQIESGAVTGGGVRSSIGRTTLPVLVQPPSWIVAVRVTGPLALAV